MNSRSRAEGSEEGGVPEEAYPEQSSLWAGRARLIVVPLDGSDEAKCALRAARAIGEIERASVHVVCVTERPLSTEELLQRVKLRREETHGIVIEQRTGDPTDAIVRTAEEKQALLIVMASLARVGPGHRFARSVVEGVALRAPCPVLLVRPEASQRLVEKGGLRRMLLPLDGAPSSAAVIEPVLEMADRVMAEVDILYIATQESRPSEPGSLVAPRYVDQWQYEWPAWAQEFLERFGTALGEHRPRMPERMFLRAGEPAEEILRFAQEVESDLIVLEWRGRLDPAHGTVVKNVLAQAPCPVLLLRAPLARRQRLSAA